MEAGRTNFRRFVGGVYSDGIAGAVHSSHQRKGISLVRNSHAFLFQFWIVRYTHSIPPLELPLSRRDTNGWIGGGSVRANRVLFSSAARHSKLAFLARSFISGRSGIALSCRLDLLGNAFGAAWMNAIATLQSVPMSIWILVLLIRRAKEGAPDSRLLLLPVLLQQLGNDLSNIAMALSQAGWITEQPVWIEKGVRASQDNFNEEGPR